jgi:hypothetical protein
MKIQGIFTSTGVRIDKPPQVSELRKLWPSGKRR